MEEEREGSCHNIHAKQDVENIVWGETEGSCPPSGRQDPILKKLNGKNNEIVESRKLNVTLEKNMKNLLDENLAWTKYVISCEMKEASLSHKFEAALAQVSRLHGLLPPMVL